MRWWPAGTALSVEGGLSTFISSVLLEGIAKAKAAGVYKGRQASIDSVRVREMKAQGFGAAAIAKALGIGRARVYGVLDANEV